MKRKVRLLALPCGTPTGIAWAIGETIGLTIGFTNESLRIVFDLRGIGAKAGVRAGTALMRLLQFVVRRAGEPRLRENFRQFLIRLRIQNRELVTEAMVCRIPE